MCYNEYWNLYYTWRGGRHGLNDAVNRLKGIAIFFPDTTDEFIDIHCKPDEEVNKYAHCSRNCSNVGETIICSGEGPIGCRCIYPKIRGPNGRCIMPEECPQIQQYPQSKV